MWGGPPLTDLDRAQYSADYKVTFSYSDGGKAGSYDLVSHVSRTSRSAAEAAATNYLSWHVGDLAVLQVNNLGGVSSAAHPTGAR
jgi:hypothetical protein